MSPKVAHDMRLDVSISRLFILHNIYINLEGVIEEEESINKNEMYNLTY